MCELLYSVTERNNHSAIFKISRYNFELTVHFNFLKLRYAACSLENKISVSLEGRYHVDSFVGNYI